MSQEQITEHFIDAVELLWLVFPKQELGCPMTASWPQCQLYSPHVLALNAHYRDDEFGTDALGDEVRLHLAELFFNCSW